jgi:hypothetical protein
MTETERYLFDLHGYLVIRDVLSEKEVEEINVLIDKILPSWDVRANAKYIVTGWDDGISQDGNTDPNVGSVSIYVGRLLDWGEPIRRLSAIRKYSLT